DAGGRARPPGVDRRHAAAARDRRVRGRPAAERVTMALRIEDYALIGDNHTAALVGRDGSIDWLCAPRFDSGGCFAAILGDARHGRGLIAPAGDGAHPARRRYRDGTLVLETDFVTEDGAVRVVDCMPRRTDYPHVARVVEGLHGRVAMRMELVIRFDYGST